MIFEIDRDKVDLDELYAMTACVNDAPWHGLAAGTMFLVAYRSAGSSPVRIKLRYAHNGHKFHDAFGMESCSFEPISQAIPIAPKPPTPLTDSET